MHVLIASDGSAAAEQAARWVGEHLPGLERVTVVTLYYMPVPMTDVPTTDWGRLLDEARQEAEAAAERACRAVASAWERRGGSGPLPVDRVVKHAGRGGVPQEVVALAEERGADLIAMGSRGLSGLRGLVVGSVTQGVLHRSRVPVLVVPRGAAEPTV